MVYDTIPRGVSTTLYSCKLHPLKPKQLFVVKRLLIFIHSAFLSLDKNVEEKEPHATTHVVISHKCGTLW